MRLIYLIIVACFLSIVSAYPQEAPQKPADSTKLEILSSVRAVYPQEAREKEIQGQVLLKVGVSESGSVDSVEIISGDPTLAKAASDAMMKWKFKPFIKNGRPIRVTANIPIDFAFKSKIDDSPEELGTGTHTAVDSKTGESKPVTLSEGVTRGMLIHKVAPTYPPAARASHVQGTVLIQAVIGKDGNIKDLRVITGPPELVPAAVGAVQQWRYRPYYLKGEPVEVQTQIKINFELRY